jgi:hypothetical protein
MEQIRRLPEAERETVAKALLAVGLESQAAQAAAVSAGAVTSISREQMKGLFVATAIPMVGFGIVDNCELTMFASVAYLSLGVWC